MSHPVLLLLGSPRLERNGVPVQMDTRKAFALLAYLAVTHQRHTRDALAALLWPEYGQTRARGALRRTLSTLNAALSLPYLSIDRESISLDINGDQGQMLQVDVSQFHALLHSSREHDHSAADVCSACLPLLTAAVELYRDDFMAGFSLRDSPAFDEWQFFQAEHLRRELGSALERLVHGYMVEQQWDRAITHGRRWLALDPLHEAAHRYLMQLYAWSGQRAAALRQYQDCERVLQTELGVCPLEETVQLYQAIKDNLHVPPPSTPARTTQTQHEVNISAPQGIGPSRVKSASALVGRNQELNALHATYGSINTAGKFIVIEGEAGIGKTRLAEEFLLQLPGATHMRGHCFEGETNLAYGPFVEALGTAFRVGESVPRVGDVPAHAMREVARLLPDLKTPTAEASPSAQLDTSSAQTRFFDGISQTFSTLCAGTPPGVLFIDDFHWADASSLDLLTYLVRRLRHQPIAILVTWRSDEVSRNHRLRLLLAEALRAGTGFAVKLDRLSEDAVVEFIESADIDARTVPVHFGQRLYQETEGLPLFVGEYLNALAQGALDLDESGWTLPGGVRDLLHGRLNSVGETGWQLLNTAAAIGRSFDFDTLREASGRSEEETITGLEELVAHGIVVEVGTANENVITYDFSHEKLRALVYDETSLARRRLLHRRIAEALARRALLPRDRGAGASQIAAHFQRAGQPTEAAQWYRLAGDHARALYANVEALSLYETALALGHPDTGTIRDAIGDLHTLMGEYSVALQSYESAANGLDQTARAATKRKVGNIHQRRGQWEQAEAQLKSALTLLGSDGPPAERARLLADLSLVAHHAKQPDRAVSAAHESLLLAEQAQDRHALAQAHNILSILAFSAGDTKGARSHGEQSLHLAEALDDPAIRAAALNNLSLALEAADDVEGAIERAEEALALCTAMGDRHHEAALHNRLADLSHAAGQASAAMTHLKQSVAIYAEIGVEAGTLQPAIWKLSEW